MKRKKYTEEQVVYALKQAENGEKIAELCRRWESARPCFTTGGRNTKDRALESLFIGYCLF
ncbi:hypothetical protein GT409_10185 [Tichowtungia aerotolerans]|uniref:Transposase n=1 Tax=Tichowtungia aerotolerans TaxID=2697043 RepID=A0A6P1M705_9BACT|nr:transposase [Tichowtungia aerotolerans]QHI69802.1 hypothetical protein GT409_10185 [Tichowtungia aerotolerans]